MLFRCNYRQILIQQFEFLLQLGRIWLCSSYHPHSKHRLLVVVGQN
jgi:hypothetical protein